MTNMANIVKILEVRIDNFYVGEIRKIINNMLNREPEQKFITTLNPEILLKASRDENYKKILNSADLNICDGFGIKLVSFLKGRPLKARLAGADLVDFLLRRAEEKNQKVFVVAAENSLSRPAEIEQAIREKYPNIWVKSAYHFTSQDDSKNDIIEKAEIVFVNFGAPDQEKFIYEKRTKFPNAKILIGVGGTFDFLTGEIKRAPKWMRKAGLEWLWRLAKEPKRIKRIWNAVVVFPMIAILN